ncbi:MAG: hypothetical protein A2W25_12070 [candidate division Zixibacteria bacterium RBG_16_53_22]|nr:MAG: hypothetical protein A2W25_12070 [candidate division Zixibacteria bacterium RBG_16_53_22]
MFKTTAPRMVMPMTLVERVFHGKSIGIPTDTVDDHVCGDCLTQSGHYNTLFEIGGVWQCIVHGQHCRRVHKSKEPGYAALYEDELNLRRNKVTDPKYAVVKSQRTEILVPSEAERKPLMLSLISAGVVRREDFEEKTDMAAEYLAAICLIHGLNAMTKEVSVWPIKRNVSGKWKVVGIETHIGRYAYQRQAEDRARSGEPFSRGKLKQLSAEEVLRRRANICQSCKGKKTTGSGDYAKKCNQCDGAGEFEPGDVIVLIQPLWLNNEVKDSFSIGIPRDELDPVYGEGVWQPGQNIPTGRSPYWVAETRAIKDAFKRAYSLNFWLPSLEMLGLRPREEFVVVEGMGDEGNGDVIEGTAQEVVEEPIMAEEEQPELPGIETPQFDAACTPEGITPAQKRLAELGRTKGKDQLNLLKALYGPEKNWANLTVGELHNMVTYASESLPLESNQAAKDVLKEECRERTRKGEFWT